MASPWSLQDLGPHISSPVHSMSPPNTNAYAAFTSMTGLPQLQDTSNWLSLMSSEGPEQAHNLDAFSQNQSLSLSPYQAPIPSRHAPATSNLDTPINPNTLSSSGASSLFLDHSYKQSRPDSIASCRQDSPKSAKTTCTSSHQSCLSSALEILQALHIPPTTCLCSIDDNDTLANNRQPRRTDSVLATNRTALRGLSGILQCSCVSSSQLQLVIVVICDKLIAWYRAVMRSFPDRRRDTCSDRLQHASDPTEASHESTSSPNERVLYQRFALGNCSFNDSLESKILTQVISSELQQLETVVVNIAARIREEDGCELDQPPDERRKHRTSAIDAPGLSSSVCDRLTTHLLEELEGIKIEIARAN
ncbi:MAG: hypothetical protein L6R39_000856 [Caloplaca ligustica]|nr:MAG: hypothetical protein L6R39_000856 [Caloplaca ligustica]